MSTYVVGIDPGVTGAVAWIDADFVMCRDLERMAVAKGRGELNCAALIAVLPNRKDILHAYVERAAAMPNQGVSSTFRYGQAYGMILGVLMAYGIPHSTVHPGVWKRAMAVPKGKDGSRQRAAQIYPKYADQWSLKKHHHRADAVLIARYGIEKRL